MGDGGEELERGRDSRGLADWTPWHNRGAQTKRVGKDRQSVRGCDPRRSSAVGEVSLHSTLRATLFHVFS